MDIHFAEILRPLLGLVLGASVGAGFGLIQQAAQRRYQRKQDRSRLPHGWAVVPGSMLRVAYLLIALVVAQVISPALFAGAAAWWVSGGVALGYGGLLVRHLLQHRQNLILNPTRRG